MTMGDIEWVRTNDTEVEESAGFLSYTTITLLLMFLLVFSGFALIICEEFVTIVLSIIVVLLDDSDTSCEKKDNELLKMKKELADVQMCKSKPVIIQRQTSGVVPEQLPPLRRFQLFWFCLTKLTKVEKRKTTRLRPMKKITKKNMIEKSVP